MLLYELARACAQDIREVTPVGSRGTEELVRIAAQFGAMVNFQPLDDSISGVVIRENGGAPNIYINSLEPLTRQRFTLAHEIGHLVERSEARDNDFSFVDLRSNGEYNLHEFFADEFAGELLMPANDFLAMLSRKGEYATSVHFGVSVSAVRMRKKRLDKNPAVAN